MKFKFLPIEYVDNRRKYVLFKNDCGVTDVARKGGIYESYIFDYIKNYIPVENINIIDIGANFGFHSLEFADLIGDYGKVYSFEPQRLVYYQLCANVILNGYDNIFTYNVALGNKNGNVFMENPDYYSTNTINIGNSHVDKFLTYNNQVELKKLDDYKLDNISVIKIDAQGFEPFILDGAIQTIKQNNPYIFIEIELDQLQIYGFTFDDISNRLISLGYTLKEMSNVDYVAIPEKTHVLTKPRIKKTYKDVNGWFGFESFYTNIIPNYLKDGMNILEMGVFDGKSVCFLANYIKSHSLKINLYAVDCWVLDEDYNRFIQNINDCDVSDVIIPVRFTSEEASKQFENNYFDFIFIDGLHDYDNVKLDIQSWYPKLKLGGIIGGDDYDPCWEGVRRAVDEIFGDIAKKYWPVWYVFKK